DVVADDECDVGAAELPRELASLREQLEGGSRRAAADGLDERPAVVGRAGLLGQVAGLLPGGRSGRPLLRQLADSRRRRLDRLDPLTGPLGRDVPYGEDARGRAGLAEALVVLAHLVDEIGRRPDVDRAVSWRRGMR